jgi:hypothetical protein
MMYSVAVLAEASRSFSEYHEDEFDSSALAVKFHWSVASNHMAMQQCIDAKCKTHNAI